MFQNGFILPEIGFKFIQFCTKMVSIMLHVCSNNETKIGVKPGDSGMKPGSNRNEIESFWSHKLRGCVPDSFTRLEFSFMNGSSFELYSDHFARVSYVVVFQIRFTFRIWFS